MNDIFFAIIYFLYGVDLKKMNNTLIDNSDNLKLVDTIKEILADISINQIDIATGYWDIPGMMLLTDVFDSFLQRNNAKLRLLIGKDPLLMIKHNNNPKYKDFKYPEDFIRSDINEIEVKPEYEKAVSFLLKYLDNQDKMEIRIFKENENKYVPITNTILSFIPLVAGLVSSFYFFSINNMCFACLF